MRTKTVIGLISTFIIACVIFCPSIAWLPTKPPVVSQPVVENTATPTMVEWVYNHSNKLSRAQCTEIVTEVRKTNKALLLLALMEVESNFVPTAVSNKGALGLTQVMPGVWEKHLITRGIIKERRDLFNIINSIVAGNEVLSIALKDAKGDVAKALEIYLGGRDGYYTKRILSHLGNLYLLTEVGG